MRANAVVDKHAKATAMQDKPPGCDFELIRVEADRLRDVSTWIGVATHAANNWPEPREEGDTGPVKLMRDSSAIRLSKSPPSSGSIALSPVGPQRHARKRQDGVLRVRDSSNAALTSAGRSSRPLGAHYPPKATP